MDEDKANCLTPTKNPELQQKQRLKNQPNNLIKVTAGMTAAELENLPLEDTARREYTAGCPARG
jgi:hypothetical protein